MPVYGGTTIVAPGFRLKPNLPNPPERMEAVLYYLKDLDKAVTDAQNEVRQRVQSFVNATGAEPFGAASVLQVITFRSPLPDADYVPVFTPDWNTTLWVTAQTVNGFTINVGVAPGGAGGTVRWAVLK